MKIMKIGIFSECYKPILNGVVHSIDGFRRGLTELGHEVFIFAPHYKEKIKEKNIISCHSLPLPGKSGYHYILSFRNRVINIARAMDIIHTQHPFIMGNRAYKIAEKYNIPFVFTNHTQYEQYAHYAPIGKGLMRWYLKYYMKRFWQKCDLIIAPAPSIKDKLLEEQIETPIEIVPNGIDLDRFKNCHRNYLVKRYHLQNWPVFIFIGRLAEEKNLTFLIQAFQKVQQKNPHCYLLLVGGGPEEKNYQKLIDNWKLQNKIIITGYQPYGEIPNYLASADIFVSASKTEVHPLTVLEAMASGLPSIVFDTVGTGEIIKNEINGLKTKTDDLSEFTETMIKILENRNLGQNLGRQARDDAQKYSFLETSKIMLEVYKKAIKIHNNKSS